MSIDPLAADPLADPLAADPLAADPLAAPQPLAPQPQAPRTQKQHSNVYTMMLIVSFAAMVTACVVLYMHLQTYKAEGATQPWWSVPQDVKSAAGP
jgi:hypothetical protein